jgi:hypothetical protein
MSRTKVFTDLSRVRDVSKRVPVAPPADGFTYVPDGKEAYTFEVSLDMDLVYRMAHRAAMNKTGTAKRGALQIKVTKRVKL